MQINTGIKREKIGDILVCEIYGSKAAQICKGNPHNCVKVKYHKEATNTDWLRYLTKKKKDTIIIKSNPLF